MKNRFALTLMATLICSTLAMAQLQKLPAPAKTGGKPIMEALWDRGLPARSSATRCSLTRIFRICFLRLSA